MKQVKRLEISAVDLAFYNWKKKYSGMDSQELRRLKELEEEKTVG